MDTQSNTSIICQVAKGIVSQVHAKLHLTWLSSISSMKSNSNLLHWVCITEHNMLMGFKKHVCLILSFQMIHFRHWIIMMTGSGAAPFHIIIGSSIIVALDTQQTNLGPSWMTQSACFYLVSCNQSQLKWVCLMVHCLHKTLLHRPQPATYVLRQLFCPLVCTRAAAGVSLLTSELTV